MPLSQADLNNFEYKLQKRGFRRDDVFLHECKECHNQAVATYVISGKAGGRDIALCLECGKSWSHRSGSGLNERVEDPDFDLKKFLG